VNIYTCYITARRLVAHMNVQGWKMASKKHRFFKGSYRKIKTRVPLFWTTLYNTGICNAQHGHACNSNHRRLKGPRVKKLKFKFKIFKICSYYYNYFIMTPSLIIPWNYHFGASLEWCVRIISKWRTSYGKCPYVVNETTQTLVRRTTPIQRP